MSSPDRSSPATRQLVWILLGSAVLVVVVALILGATVSPALYAIALVAVVDVIIARLLWTGRIAPSAGRAGPDG